MTPEQEQVLLAEWDRCKAWIIPALAVGGDTHSPDDVLENLLTGKNQLWPGRKSAIVSEVIVEPRQKILLFWLAGGDKSEILTIQAAVIAWGKSIGCTKAKIYGRKGWERTLPEWSYEATVLTRDI